MDFEQNSEDNGNETEFVNPQEKKYWKVLFIFLLLCIGFIALIVRLVNLQITENQKYRNLARRQHESKVKLKAERGNIYDRNGRLLASTIKSYSFAIDPTILKNKDTILNICNLVAEASGRDNGKELYRRVVGAKGAFVWLTRGLLPEKTKSLDSIKTHGFIKIIEPKRIYLYGSVASQIIGCTNIDNKGLTGIELVFDSLLSGADSYVMMLRDASGHLIPTPTTLMRQAVKGKSIVLTIDVELQRIVEYELKLGVEHSKAESGTAVIINPQTGEILAMASYPTFNPNDISNVNSELMRNRAITDTYEPGSTFKLITAAAALEEGIVTPETIVDGHDGIIKFKDYTIKDEHKTGKVTFSRAMELSSNVVFSSIAYKIRPNKLYKYVRDFGFGLHYGINLPGEAKGKIKKPAELDGVSRRYLGFGYGISVTSLQMANAYATIANKGLMMKPYVVKKLIDNDGNIIYEVTPDKIRRVTDKSTAVKLTEMLTGVVERGTGKAAALHGLKIAGKTGTAQIFDSAYSKKHYVASFAGYLPADNPKIAMMIVLDKPKTNIYGGSTAAPIFRNIAQSWISVSNDLLSDLKNSEDADKIVIIPDFTGLDYFSAVKILKKLGLKHQKYDKNFVIASQMPPSGTKIKNKNNITIKFSPSKKKKKRIYAK